MKYDVVFLSDLRFPGGTATAIADDARALSEAGLTVGLVHLDMMFRNRPEWGINKAVTRALENEYATLIDPSTEHVEAGLAAMHNPMVLRFPVPETGVPKITARSRVIVAHQPPADARGHLYYDPVTVAARAEQLMGGRCIWAPIGPACRQTFHHVPGDVLCEDWTNVVFVDDWGTARTGPADTSPIIIGRHSRDGYEKWPSSRRDLLQVYPDDPAVRVRLLGVGEAVTSKFDALPDNWEVLPFGAEDAKTFLTSIDYFVYYHHPDWVEAFGRNIAEAVAAGVIAVLPEHFRATFGDAALYADPEAALDLVRDVHTTPGRYAELSRSCRESLDRRYGPARHVALVKDLLAGKAETTRTYRRTWETIVGRYRWRLLKGAQRALKPVARHFIRR